MGGGGSRCGRSDFSCNYFFCRVRIVASVPGAHTGKNMHKWGHMKLRKVRQNQSAVSPASQATPRFSTCSIGKLGVA